MAKQQQEGPTFIRPDCLYSLAGFRRSSGISATRMREARKAGIVPRTIEVGRRKFIRGSDAIEFIERLGRQAALVSGLHSDS